MHSTSNLNDGYIGSGRRLWLSINKHGKENHSFEVLEFLPTRLELKAREEEIVNETLLADPMCMNLQLGGGGGFINEEHQLKCSAAGGKANNPRKSQLASERAKAEMEKRRAHGTLKTWSETCSWTGRTHRSETKSKIGDANSVKQKGVGNSQFGTKWMIHQDSGPVKVKAEAVLDYLRQGYSLGRRLFDK